MPGRRTRNAHENQDGSPTDEHPLVLFTSQDGAVTVPAWLDRGDRLDMP
jgi:hypothetical protein